MNAEMIWGIVRTILAAGMGWAAAKGFVDEQTGATIVGAIGTLFIAGWSIWSKRKPAA